MERLILLLLIAICPSTLANSQDLQPVTSETESSNLNSQRYPGTAIVYARVQWICLGKVWVPNAMLSGDLIWGAQIAILGYTLALLAFGVEWVLRRAQFA